MKVKIDVNLEKFAVLMGYSTDECPRHLVLNDSDSCGEADCYDCWVNALKEGEIKDE